MSEDERMKNYLHRREITWCAAFGEAVVQLKIQMPAIDEITLRARAIALAGLAVALMPGAPGEDEQGPNG